MRAFLSTVLLLIGGVVCAPAQSDPLQDAVEALQRGDVNSAELTLRAELKTHPNNAEALDVLGVVLDRQKKFSEADGVYRRAVGLSPHAPALLNNYGNHLLTTGKLSEARAVFLQVIAVNPTQANALLQLARLSLQRKLPAEALTYLDRIPRDSRQFGETEIARMQALYALHRDKEAEAVYSRVSAGAQSDARSAYSLGVALAAAGQYAKGEEMLSRALAAAPENFDILYNLGLTASHAGHNERARDILQSALRQQPENVDVLYDLAAVNAVLGQREKAVKLLADAARLAPERADVQQLLARTTADAGYFGDAVQAWDRYLKLVPADDVGRRERAFAVTAIGEDMEGGLAELRAFVATHPKDAVGHYELGIAEAVGTPEKALSELDRALVLRPDLTPAHIARALLRFKKGNFIAALPDFEFAAKREPNNAVVQDRLGQTYMALEHPAEALPFLRRAAELAPNDSKTLMHLARALTSAGHPEEAKAVFTRFRELGPDRSALPHPAGLVDFLSLSSQEQLARYRAGVERTVRSNPDNAEAQVRYLKLLLDDHNSTDAAVAAHHLLELKPSAPLLSDASRALLAAGQYGLAREVLEHADASDSAGALRLDLAIATFHTTGAQAGLSQLDRVPEKQRTGDYYLARAEMLDSAGRPDEAAAELNRALRANPERPELYRYATSFLIGKHRGADALELLSRGARSLPDNPDILLLRAIVMEADSRSADAEHSLIEIERRWPDWYRVWLAHAIVLEWQGKREQAAQMLETASALGAHDAKALAKSAIPGSANSDAAARALRLMQLVFG